MTLTDIQPVTALEARPENGILEAPRRLDDGTILFTDLAGGVLSIPPDAAEPETLIPRRKGVGGLAPHADGGIVVTGRTVTRLDADGRQRDLLEHDHVRGYNDLHVLPDGSLLVGALLYAPMAGEEPTPGEVWHIPADGGAAHVVIDDVTWPNGIGTSPDGHTIYVADTAHGVVRAYADGAHTGEVFATVPEGAIADGLAIDVDGGLWLALGRGAVAHYDAAGTLQETVDVPTRFTSSIAFHGHDVVITAAVGMFTAKAATAGLKVPSAAT